MLIHPRREGLKVLKILYKKRIINSAASGETQETKVLLISKIDQGTRQRSRVLVEG